MKNQTTAGKLRSRFDGIYLTYRRNWVAWESTIARGQSRRHRHGQEYLPMPPE